MAIDKTSQGFEAKLFLIDEASDTTPSNYGTIPAAGFGTSDSLSFTEFQDSFNQAHSQDTRMNGSRSRLATVKLRKDGSLSLTKKVNPSGSAGTKPQEDLLLQSVLGTKASAATSVIYSPSVSSTRKSLSAYYERGFFGEYFAGIVPNSLTFNFSGSDVDTISVDSLVADKYRVGTDELSTAVTSDAVTLSVASGTNYTVNTRIRLASEIMLVTAISGNVLTVTRGYESTTNTTHSAGVSVVPPTYTHTLNNNLIGGTLGQLSINTTPVEFIDGSITIDNQAQLINDEVGSEKASGFVDGAKRIVSGTFNIRLYKNKFHIPGLLENFTDLAITLTRGDTAGKKILFTLSQCKGTLKEITKGAEAAQYQIEFQAEGSSGEDEISIKYF